MSHPQKNPALYTEGEPTNQTPALAKLIANILTISMGEAKGLIDKYEEDAEAIYNILVARQGIDDLLSRKWRKTVIALLPMDCWVPLDPSVPKGSPYFVEGAETPPATLWHCRVVDAIANREETEETRNAEVARRAEADRKLIMEELAAALSREHRTLFAPLVGWYGDGALEQSRQKFAAEILKHHPGREDINLWVVMDVVEEFISVFRCPIEKGFRKSLDLADYMPTPPRYIGGMEALAIHEGYSLISDVLENVGGSYPDTEGKPGHLLLTVLCNLAANRLLLERFRVHELGKIATRANVAFLKTLAQCGVHEAPLQGNESFEKGLKEVLTKVVGPGSKWARTVGLEQGLKGVDLDNVMHLGKKAFDEYLRTRGRSLAEHTGPLEQFVAVLALTACWFERAKVPNMNNPSARELSAFPVNSSFPENWQPTAEHMELYKIMIGQLLFGNTGYELNADSVTEYAEAHRARHACIQHFLSDTFKRNAPSLLLTLASCPDEMFKRLAAQRLRSVRFRFEESPFTISPIN